MSGDRALLKEGKVQEALLEALEAVSHFEAANKRAPSELRRLVDTLAIQALAAGSTQGFPGAVLTVRAPAPSSAWTGKCDALGKS